MSCYIEYFSSKLIAEPINRVVKLDCVAKSHLRYDFVQSFHKTHLTKNDLTIDWVRYFNLYHLIADILSEWDMHYIPAENIE